MAGKKKILYPVVFMVLLTAVYTAVLALISVNTAETIEAQESLQIKRSVLYALGATLPGSSQSPFEAEKEAVEAVFSEQMTAVPYSAEKMDDAPTGEQRVYYAYTPKEAQAPTGYVFSFSGKGLWGTIRGYIAVDSQLSRMLGIDFIAHSETPGLGGRIDEDVFKAQFRGLPLNETDTVVFTPAAGGTLDAITGATLTSDSVRRIVNAWVPKILSFAKEAGI